MVRSIKNIIAAMLIAISVFIMWTNILPKYNYFSALKLAIGTKQTLLESRERIADRVAGLQDEQEQKYAELQRLKLVIPEEKNLAELVSSLDKIFSKNSVNPRELSLGSGSGIAGALTNNITFDVSGELTYEALLNLLDDIEKNIRLMDITSFDVSIIKDQLAIESIRLSLQMRGSAYYLKPLSEIIKISGDAGVNAGE